MFLSKSRLAIAPAATRSFSSPLSSHLVYRASTTTPHSSMSSSSSPPPQDDENRNAHARNAIQISPGQENETQLIADATALLNQEGRRRWKLVQEGKGVQREFLFKTFKGTWVRSSFFFFFYAFSMFHFPFASLVFDVVFFLLDWFLIGGVAR